ncbi:hypothetical protein CEXT_400291 [Caerostris extrusa]|uniref:Uncharacterized protein n=1 Tax=Caerostris extrusa TaxID=172846 RepID=A0AAV4QBW4_CAEEX|nr:hypothetical protein CEXT_400291 [Caerostris extrusa]
MFELRAGHTLDIQEVILGAQSANINIESASRCQSFQYGGVPFGVRLDDSEEPADVPVEHGRLCLRGHDDPGQVGGDGIQLPDPGGRDEPGVQDPPPGACQIVARGDEQERGQRVQWNQVTTPHGHDVPIVDNCLVPGEKKKKIKFHVSIVQGLQQAQCYLSWNPFRIFWMGDSFLSYIFVAF